MLRRVSGNGRSIVAESSSYLLSSVNRCLKHRGEWRDNTCTSNLLRTKSNRPKFVVPDSFDVLQCRRAGLVKGRQNMLLPFDVISAKWPGCEIRKFQTDRIENCENK